MFCNKCGAENPDDGVFCQKCGASLSGASSSPPANAGPASSPSPGVIEAFKALPIPTVLSWGAIALLLLGFLTGILAATDSSDAATFFRWFMDGVFYGGVVLALSVMVAMRK